MSHPEQMTFIRLCKEYLCTPADNEIIEIGSYDVNEGGGGIRGVFSNAQRYIGVDLTEGPGVDVVASGHEVDFPDNEFDIAISSECFEHNPYWAETFVNMWRMTKPGGLVIVTVASTGRVEHGTSRTDPKLSPGTSAVKWDYYRNLAEKDFTQKLDFQKLFDQFEFYSMWSSQDLYFWGVKTGGTRQRQVDTAALRQRVSHVYKARKQAMTSLGWVARIGARAPLWLLSKALPEKPYQSIAIFYARSCYFLVNRLRIPVARHSSESQSGSD
jgi:SAM-dependent methyltransferase